MARSLEESGAPSGNPLSDVSLADRRSLGREFVDRRGLEVLAPPENGERKLGVIGRVGEMLSLKAKCVAAVIGLASLAVNPIQEVAGIKLEAGLGGRHFELAARMRIISLRRYE